MEWRFGVALWFGGVLTVFHIHSTFCLHFTVFIVPFIFTCISHTVTVEPQLATLTHHHKLTVVLKRHSEPFRPGAGVYCTRVDTKINGHEDKRSDELFKNKWCKQQICTN